MDINKYFLIINKSDLFSFIKNLIFELSFINPF